MDNINSKERAASLDVFVKQLVTELDGKLGVSYLDNMFRFSTWNKFKDITDVRPCDPWHGFLSGIIAEEVLGMYSAREIQADAVGQTKDSLNMAKLYSLFRMQYEDDLEHFMGDYEVSLDSVYSKHDLRYLESDCVMKMVKFWEGWKACMRAPSAE